MVQISFEELFDPGFMESLRRLRFVAGRVPMGGRFAEQRSKAMGHGIEFRDFRPYTAGDDLRAVDWNIYRRLGRVFLRLFEEFEDLPVYLMPDISKSGFVDEAPGTQLRAHVGLRTALALGAIAFGQHDSVGLFPISDTLEVAMRPTAGADRVMAFAERLARLQRGGSTNLARALDQFGSMRQREGLVVLISDFFDPSGIQAVTQALGRLRHRLLLVQLFRPSDAVPDREWLGGDLRLVDSETSEPLDLFVDNQVLERYQVAHQNFEEHLTSFAEQRNSGLLKLNVEVDVITQLATLFESGRYEP